MKRLFRFLVYVVIIAFVTLAVYVRWVSHTKMHHPYAFTFTTGPVPAATETVLAQGKHLLETRGCGDCHDKDLGGKTVMNNFAMGHITAPNLTRGAGGVVANYSDTDWERAVRHGVRPDGRALYLMPSTDYAPMSESDMGALLAYLKSLPPVDRTVARLALGPMARVLLVVGKIKLAADEIDHEGLKPTVVTPGPTAEYGKYLATTCTGCHGPNLSGGKIAAGPPNWPPAANLTPHSEGHLTKWSEADFLAAIRTGKRPDGTEINPVMPRALGLMTDTELKALWLFLKTVPAVTTGAR